MREVDRSKPILVTGGSGYLASWIVKILLDEGLHVRATVRNPEKTESIAHLEKLAVTSRGKLELHPADLLTPGSFDTPMRDCELVIHTASPFFLTRIRNAEEELIRPAKEGTRNVLEAARMNPSVKRIVLTSSVYAVYGDNADLALTENDRFTENEWNLTSNARHQPYAYAKTLAEIEAWIATQTQDRWDLVVINPGWMLGPSLSLRTDSTSIKEMIAFGRGDYKSGAPKLWMGVVDVRDVAAAHIEAGFTPEASGRHILVSEELTFYEIAAILRRNFGDRYPFPRREAPKFLFWLVAPLYGHTRRFVRRNVGIPIKFDNAYSISDLKVTYTPVEETIKAHFQQILDDGLLG